MPHWLKRPARAVVAALDVSADRPPRLARMVRSATPEKVRAQARALRPLIAPTVKLVRELARDAGAEELIHQRGHLYVYRSAEALAKDALAWELRHETGVEVDEFDADELRQLEPVPVTRVCARPAGARKRAHQQPARPRDTAFRAVPARRRRDRACPRRPGFGSTASG